MIYDPELVEISIRYERLPAQRELSSYVGRPDLVKAILYTGGFGSGKTHALSNEATKLAGMNMGCYGGLISPTYKQQQRALLPTLKAILNENDVPYYHAKSDAEIWFLWDGEPFDGDLRPTVSVAQLCSADNPDSIKGPNWAWFGVDEPGLCTREAFIFMLSRLRDMNARCRQAVLAGTPEDTFENPWLPEMFVDPVTRREGFHTVYASTRDAVRAGVVPEDFLTDLEATMTAEMARAYIDGEFLAFKSGLVYSGFTLRHHTNDDIAYDEAVPLWLGVDFNVEPMCAVLGQPGAGGYRFGVFDEFYLPRPQPGESATGAFCREFKKRYPKARHKAGLVLFGDASGGALKSSATDTDWGIIADELGTYNGYGSQVPTVNPGEWERVTAVNNAFEKNLVGIHPSCEALVRDLVRTPKREGLNAIDKKKDPALTHLSDALGYIIAQTAEAWLGTRLPHARLRTGRRRRSVAGTRQWDEGMPVGV